MFQLRFPEDELSSWAGRYRYGREDTELLARRPAIEARGHLTRDDLLAVCEWKSPRRAGEVGKNPEGYIEEITGFALSATHERSRIESLTLLDGVQWATASVILHLYHSAPYPILDFRALWSLSVEQPSQYAFDFWISYVEYCRRLADQSRIDMRTLDRALWQYSKDNQSADTSSQRCEVE